MNEEESRMVLALINDHGLDALDALAIAEGKTTLADVQERNRIGAKAIHCVSLTQAPAILAAATILDGIAAKLKFPKLSFTTLVTQRWRLDTPEALAVAEVLSAGMMRWGVSGRGATAPLTAAASTLSCQPGKRTIGAFLSQSACFSRRLYGFMRALGTTLG